MWAFRPIKYKEIEAYDADYYRRSHDTEAATDADYYGVFLDGRLVAYFAVQDGTDDGLFIRRGYVLP
jgi:hypothetical protein